MEIFLSTKYSSQMADAVCEKIMDGLSLRKIEALPGMPRRITILKWLRENPEFQTQYAHAREEQAELLAEEILEIADDGKPDFSFDPEQGLIVDGDAIQRARLRVDSRKWIASKLKPKKYGDKIDHNHGGQQDNPVKASIDINFVKTNE